MARLGAFCYPGSGHINPVTALARALELRGHNVVIFGVADIEQRVRAAGIQYHQIGAADFPAGTIKASDELLSRLRGMAAFRFTIERIASSARMILRDGPAAVRHERIDALLVDEVDVAGTIGEHLGLPFLSIAIIPPMNQSDQIPPVFFGWRPGTSWLSRFRNRMGLRLLKWIGKPLSDLLNEKRDEWGLKRLAGPIEALSPIARIALMPRAFEFELATPPGNLFYTGPWVNAAQRPPVEFPWDKLDGRQLIYASLGTLQNGSESVFRTIADACSGLPVQLVIALGGGLKPEQLGPLAGNPVVVSFAPQLDLLKRADVVITHAGINTVLESLSEGVPLVAIPLGNDQPGVAARLRERRVGVVIRPGKLSPARLRRAVRLLLEDPNYRTRAQQLGHTIREIDGPAAAAEIIERSLRLFPPFSGAQIAHEPRH